MADAAAVPVARVGISSVVEGVRETGTEPARGEAASAYEEKWQARACGVEGER